MIFRQTHLDQSGGICGRIIFLLIRLDVLIICVANVNSMFAPYLPVVVFFHGFAGSLLSFQKNTCGQRVDDLTLNNFL